MKKSYILKNYENLKNNNVSIDTLVNDYQQNISKIASSNSIITNCNDLQKEFKLSDNLLSGCLYSLKDNIITKGIKTTGGSLFLENFIPPYDSTIYGLLKQSGAILTSKSNLDEFGMSGTGLDSGFGMVKNILDQSRITGGSSSGAVNLVASGLIHFAIGSDTGDSVRRPASFLGVVGFKPTYGLISRYGVLPYAPSLDHLGIITRSVTDIAVVADQICKFDPKDYTSQKLEHNFYKDLKELKHMNISVIKGIEKDICENERKIYLTILNILKESGHYIIEKEVDNNLLNAINPTYKIISNIEGLSSYGSFTGIPFGSDLGANGYKNILLKNRNQFFNNQVKRRLIIGACTIADPKFNQVFQQAKKVRTLLVNLSNNLLDNVDCLLLPSASSIAPKINDVLSGKYSGTNADAALVLANFAGLPSITVPVGKYNNMPWGINVTCKQNHDQDALNAALTIENLIGGNNE